MYANDSLNMSKSYFTATAVDFSEKPQLQGEHQADVVVIGGGCTGLSAALFAAQAGLSVILLEAGRIGWGASGRNGGQMIPGIRYLPSELIKMFGRDLARQLFSVAVEGREVMVDLIHQHSIACDFKPNGQVTAAVRPSELPGLAKEADLMGNDFNYPHARILTAEDMRQEVDSPLYCGGFLHEKGGHIHPLNYTLGLAGVADRAGVTLFENSAALNIEDGAGVTVTTAQGRVKARYSVIACDALIGGLDSYLQAHMMPVGSYIIATQPLGDRADALIPNDRAVADTLFNLHYFRLSADKRLLFSGGEHYLPGHPKDIAAKVLKELPRVFPQLSGARAEYNWGGIVSVTPTRLPHFGRRGNRFFAHGYSGEGVILTTLAGKLIAEALVGTAERFDLFAKIEPPAFPGGVRFRYPLYVMAMLWFALRDRL